MADQGRSWLRDFAADEGRPLRVLHIGNIANNAYLNAKIQRRIGIEADVISYDYFHVMGTPEWEDADFAGDVGDDNFPDWWAVDLRGFVRPRWFAQGRMSTCIRYLEALREGDAVRAALAWRALRGELWLRSRRSVAADATRLAIARSRPVRRVAAGALQRLRARRPGAAVTPTASSAPDPLHERLARAYRLHFPDRPPLRQDDYSAYLGVLPEWQRLFRRYDVIHAYATDPLIPLLAGEPYVAYEHGTIREIPFEDSARGRTTALAYVEADAVCITNLDNLIAADRLGLDDTRVVCLPHAVDSDRLRAFHAAHADAGPSDDVVRIFSPSRQDWVDADPSWTKGNDRLLRAFRRVVDSGRRWHLTLVAWGRDLEASRALVRELQLEAHVDWIPTLRKDALWLEYLRSHAVADQFVLPGFGGVTFEALALGRRVISSLDVELAAEFFGEVPPLLVASSVDEIERALLRVANDAADIEGLGKQSEQWFSDYHSAERILELELAAYRRIVEAGSAQRRTR